MDVGQPQTQGHRPRMSIALYSHLLNLTQAGLWKSCQPRAGSRFSSLTVYNDVHTRHHFLDGPLDPTRDSELVMNLLSHIPPGKNRKEGFVAGLGCTAPGHVPPPHPEEERLRRRYPGAFIWLCCTTVKGSPWVYILSPSLLERSGKHPYWKMQAFLMSVIPKVYGYNQL